MLPMKPRVYIIALVAALLLLTIPQTVFAQVPEKPIAAGVAPGQQFTYGVTGTYPASIAESYIPQEVLSAQATQYFKVTILSVSGPEIGYAWSWHFNNGSDPLDGNATLNIETTTNTGPFWPIVAANLSAGDMIHAHYAPDTSTFNETIQYAYTNYTRATNRLETFTTETNNITTRDVHSDAYFDKLTGMLVKLNDVTDYQDPVFQTTLTWTLLGQTAWTSTTVGSNPPVGFFTLPVIIAIAVVAAFAVVFGAWFASKKRRDARRRQLLRKK